MRAILQRVKSASVSIQNKTKASIGAGLLVLLGISQEDSDDDILWICRKIVAMRIFPDQNGLMNLSVKETGGDILVVSQFTLFASTKKGNRPSFIAAARPETAVPLYQKFLTTLTAESGKTISSGEFGADMQVELVNDGPVTILLDSKKKE